MAKDLPFKFTDECLKTIHILKQALISAPVIQPPDWSLTLEIKCDANAYATGAVLDQPKYKKHHTIACTSEMWTWA